MKNTTNIMLVLLVVTAAILAAVLVGTYTASPAYADVSIRQGSYVMGSMTYSNSRDLIYIIDVGARQMNVYTVNTNGNRIEMLDNVNLERAFPE